MQPDTFQRIVYGFQFRIDFLTKRGTEFQNWFVRLARAALGPDFEAVRAHGRMGDYKCDGYRVSTGTVFQCYAPDRLTASKTIRKIDVDFHGARRHWTRDMNQWVLVHNNTGGLPPSVVEHLNCLRKTHDQITIQTWGEPELLKLKERLALGDLEALFGHAPTIAETESLGIEDLQPVIEALQRMDPVPGEEPLAPPSAEKLARNSFSRDATAMLQWGRKKEALVEQYFANDPRPDLGERIAESFRIRYASLRNSGLTPDEVLSQLKVHAGGTTNVPTREGAVLAVLSYFFERCDIFEDPEGVQ